MKKKLFKRAIGTIVGVQAGLTLLGGNLQTFVYGATSLESAVESEDLAGETYTLAHRQGFANWQNW